MLFHECICYKCPSHKDHLNGREYDCACESGPVYDTEACQFYCPYRYLCHVAQNPTLYPWTDESCSSCGEEYPENECPNSKRTCGHHCNHVWTHDECCWCGATFGEDGVENNIKLIAMRLKASDLTECLNEEKNYMAEIRKYDHAEAFCLMDYRCRKCGKTERLWNSRDGVTPFIIDCPECGGDMQHVDFNNDKRDPDYVPEKGQRIFIDLPKSVNKLYCKRMVEDFWNHSDYPFKDVFKTKHEAVESQLNDFREGEPYIITF